MIAQSNLTEQTEYVIDPATRMGHVHLMVADLERQVAFYTERLGFQQHWREGATAGLGAGNEDLLLLTERPGARPSRGTTGLYHTAVLVPTKWDLAQLLKRIAEMQTPIQGMTNHHTHLAIYLPDAEGNGIELAWDFPKEQWRKLEEWLRPENMSAPLDVEDLISALADRPDEWTGMDPATQIGHVHLHVSDLDTADEFYHGVLGFDKIFKLKQMGALFVSAGGYHHHIGLNVWQGVGAPPPPAGASGLRYFTVVLPNAAELERIRERIQAAGIVVEQTEAGILVRDPSQNGILLTA
jgi:catechol 2,3-dioxygenase